MDMQISDPGAGASNNGSGGSSTDRSGGASAALARLRGPERSGERLRWGMTGLAAIFLIVMLAAARLGPARVADQPGAGEPLAVLGVAPGPATRPQEK
jgi:hypothetical protein